MPAPTDCELKRLDLQVRVEKRQLSATWMVLRREIANDRERRRSN